MKSTLVKIILPLFLLVTGEGLAANTQLGNGTINIVNNSNEIFSIQVDSHWPSIQIDKANITPKQPTQVNAKQVMLGLATIYIIDSKSTPVCLLYAGSPGAESPFILGGSCLSTESKWHVRQVGSTELVMLRDQ